MSCANAALCTPCFCTRRPACGIGAASRREPVYPGTCRHLSDGERAVRAQQRMPAQLLIVPDREVAFVDQVQGSYAQNLAADCGDFLVQRSDGAFAYQLAVVVDDAAQGVTSVVRGVTLLCSTPAALPARAARSAASAYAHIRCSWPSATGLSSATATPPSMRCSRASRRPKPSSAISPASPALRPHATLQRPKLLATFDLAALPTTFDDLVQVLEGPTGVAPPQRLRCRGRKTAPMTFS
ncbi:MAG: glutamate--tRNA ligase family protein [Eggerthella lenta]